MKNHTANVGVFMNSKFIDVEMKPSKILAHDNIAREKLTAIKLKLRSTPRTQTTSETKESKIAEKCSFQIEQYLNKYNLDSEK
jgi:hypothetical protein